jgi:hypothetical protein
MEVNRLTKDEVMYEIEVRGGTVNQDSGIDSLRVVLRELMQEDHLKGILRDGRELDIETELLVIESKLTLVRLAVDDIRKGGTDSSPRRIRTLLFHLSNRINNVFPKTQGEAKNKGKAIYRSLKELSTLFRTLGDGAEFQIPEVLDTFSSTEGNVPLGINHGAEGREALDFARVDRDWKVNPQIYKWNVTFSGDNNGSVNAFIVRIEELAIARGVSEAQLLQGAVELFEGQALLWFRSVRNEITSWKELKHLLRSEFLPLDFEENLLQEIRNRKQGVDEPIGTFVACMLGLYDRLSKEIGEEDKLNQIKRNLAPYYLEKLVLQPVLSIRQLKAIAKELELNKFRIEQYEATKNRKVKSLEPDLACKQSFPRFTSKPSVQLVQSKRTGMQCWNCNQYGHRFSECQLPPKIFCHRCGYQNKLTRNCPDCNKRNRGNNINPKAANKEN